LTLVFFSRHTTTTEISTFPYTTLFRSEGVEEASVARLSEAFAFERSDPFYVLEDHSRGRQGAQGGRCQLGLTAGDVKLRLQLTSDRKSTRLNSSHRTISYAVFCLKKKN